MGSSPLMAGLASGASSGGGAQTETSVGAGPPPGILDVKMGVSIPSCLASERSSRDECSVGSANVGAMAASDGSTYLPATAPVSPDQPACVVLDATVCHAQREAVPPKRGALLDASLVQEAVAALSAVPSCAGGVPLRPPPSAVVGPNSTLRAAAPAFQPRFVFDATAQHAQREAVPPKPASGGASGALHVMSCDVMSHHTQCNSQSAAARALSGCDLSLALLTPLLDSALPAPRLTVQGERASARAIQMASPEVRDDAATIVAERPCSLQCVENEQSGCGGTAGGVSSGRRGRKARRARGAGGAAQASARALPSAAALLEPGGVVRLTMPCDVRELASRVGRSFSLTVGDRRARVRDALNGLSEPALSCVRCARLCFIRRPIAHRWSCWRVLVLVGVVGVGWRCW